MCTKILPKDIVKELDKYIIGQKKAKRAVAVALRNRWRRMQLSKSLRYEVTPKNILMIGPTGIGKTEIARRLAKLSNSPFIKVEATKFTEIGYVGKEVDSIIRDLVDYAIKIIRIQILNKNKIKAKFLAENRIVDILLSNNKIDISSNKDIYYKKKELLLQKLRNGLLDNKEIEINLLATPVGVEIMSSPGMEEVVNQLQILFQNINNTKKKICRLKIKEAINVLIKEEISKLTNFDELKHKAIELVEQQGIIFIDEIDKICRRDGLDYGVSREGVQRDLLPLVEGCSVSTKYGLVKTDHILFIASGSFQLSRPSDLIPELQGRLPIKVKLHPLTAKDFERILTETNFSLIIQYQKLLEIEGISVNFTKGGIKCIARISWKINENTENIGARRLHNILEQIMEDISYNVTQYKGTTVVIDSCYVKDKLKNLIIDEDLHKYIL